MASPRLEELRKARELSREALGVAGGVSSATVARIERGITKPQRSTKLAIALALGVPVDDIDWTIEEAA